MTQCDDLTESLRHLDYETGLIIAAARMADKHRISERHDGYYWDNDRAVAYLAGMESTLTHARLLDDFFSYTSRPTSNDRYLWMRLGEVA